MNSVAQKYNRFLVTMMAFAPLIAFISYSFLDMDFVRIMQLMSYIGVVFIFLFKPKNKLVNIPSYLIFYLLFIFYDFFSTLYLLDREFKIMYLFSNYLIGGFNFMFIIENLNISKKHFKLVLNSSLIILIIAIVVILYQQVFDKSFFVRPTETTLYSMEEGKSGNEDRLHSIYSWISVFSNGFGFVPVFLIIVELLNRKNVNIFFLTIMGLVYVILTKERWVMLNAILIFLIFILHNKNKFKQALKISILIPIITGMIIVTSESLGLGVQGILEDRVLETNDKKFNQKSASTRILAFIAFNKFYWDNPILGKGNIKYGMGGTNRQDYKLRTFLAGRSSQIHVGYLSLFYMYGLIGGILFLSFLFLLMKKLYKDAIKTRMWAPFFGILGLALANLTLVTFVIFEMGLILAFYTNKFYIQEYKRSKLANG